MASQAEKGDTLVDNGPNYVFGVKATYFTFLTFCYASISQTIVLTSRTADTIIALLTWSLNTSGVTLFMV